MAFVAEEEAEDGDSHNVSDDESSSSLEEGNGEMPFRRIAHPVGATGLLHQNNPIGPSPSQVFCTTVNEPSAQDDASYGREMPGNGSTGTEDMNVDQLQGVNIASFGVQKKVVSHGKGKHRKHSLDRDNTLRSLTKTSSQGNMQVDNNLLRPEYSRRQAPGSRKVTNGSGSSNSHKRFKR